jgi:hypothetical protein
MVQLEGLGKLKKMQLPHMDSNPQPSGLQQTTGVHTNYITAAVTDTNTRSMHNLK